MDVIGVEPKDIHVLLDFSIKEIDHILCFLDEITCEVKGKRTQDSVDFVTKKFFPMLDKLHEEITEGKNDS